MRGALFGMGAGGAHVQSQGGYEKRIFTRGCSGKNELGILKTGIYI